MHILFSLCFIVGSGCGSGNGKVDRNAYNVLGEVMAIKTTDLRGGKGSLVLVISENDKDQSTAYDQAFESFRKTLDKSVSVSGTDVVPTPKVLGPGSEPLSAAKFTELLQKHSDADYLVSFIRVPALTQGQIAQLPSPRPQVVAVTPNPQLTRAMFTSKVLCLAVLAKPETQDTAGRGSVQEQFDAHYQLITSETVGLLPH